MKWKENSKKNHVFKKYLMTLKNIIYILDMGSGDLAGASDFGKKHEWVSG